MQGMALDALPTLVLQGFMGTLLWEMQAGAISGESLLLRGGLVP